MHRRAGFTLIEIMVVIGIIILLASVLIVSFSGAFSKSKEAQTKATIDMLSSNIQTFQNRWGNPPPANLQDLGMLVGYPALSDPNQTNVGIETAVLALRSRRESGPFIDNHLLQDDNRRTNLDMDTVVSEATGEQYLDLEPGSSNDLFEIVDAWGNPLVYLDQRSLAMGGFHYEVTKADGSTTPIVALDAQNALRHPTTGQYPNSFMIWSFGENGINEYGLGDDVTSWPKYDQ